MTPKQFEVLTFVSENPGCPGSAFIFISTRHQWSHQGATRWGCGYAQRLVFAGWLTKKAGCYYWITPTGKRVLEEVAFARRHLADIEHAVFFGNA